MKVAELMIGDYVFDGNNVAQVTSITCDGIIETTFNETSNIEVIHPIPLTKEILEKNDWEKRPTGYVFYTDGKRYDNSLWYIFGSNTFIVNAAEFQIKYVHELQHVLRLCNIEKEIVL